MLDGATSTLFFNNAEDETTFQDMELIMLKKYKCDARQQQVKKILDMLRLGTFMSERDLMFITEGLKKLVNYIDNLDPQFPPYDSSEGNKIE